MPTPRIRLLEPDHIAAIQHTSLRVLAEVGVKVHHRRVLERLADAGARVDFEAKVARLDASMVESAIQRAAKQYILAGRDPQDIARFGYGDFNLLSSPGQFAWFDRVTGERRDPVLDDARDAIRVGDALANVNVVGAMTAPADVPVPIRDVVLTAELVRGSTKPTRCWPITRRSSEYVLEIYAAVAGGREALRRSPMAEVFLEPISPLQLPETGLDVMLAFLEYGQPLSIGPMAMTSGTAPATLAGTLAQENAEILAGVTVIQTLAPGTPILYGGIPHIMDPRTSICSFGSPEQGLMAVAMTEVARAYGFPVYVNVNLTDAKQLDAQAGMEKMGGLVLGMLAGADLFGHAGILGTDHGGSLAWLVADDEAMTFARRIARGFDVDDERLALEVIAAAGPGGDFLSQEHTLRHYRRELLIPDATWTRDAFGVWREKGSPDFQARVSDRLATILKTHEVEPIDPRLDEEIGRIVEAARNELAG
jgi:trimethylamine:corrinoid methyltransferase-like protein